MKFRFGRHAFVIVAIVVVAVTLFRVATAPERIEARQRIAESTCVAAGGKWTTVDKQLVCIRP